MSDQFTYQEIVTQTLAWEEALKVLENHAAEIAYLDLNSYDQVVFIGCGSTYYLSLSAAAIMQALTGVSCRAVPSSELFLSPEIYYSSRRKTALCAISRSGNTTETVRAIDDFRNHQDGKVITITNRVDSRLAMIGDLNLTIPGGYDQSVAQTRSFASMYVATTKLAVIASQRKDLLAPLDKIAIVGQRLINQYGSIAQQFGEDQNIQRLFFLGGGIHYGLACEASLKVKEMSLTVSEPFHFMEFRHGPISMVDPQTLIVSLLSEDNAEHEMAVIQDAIQYGARILTLGESNADVNFSSGIPKILRGVLYLPVLQLLAYYRAKSFGLDPDHPRNLKAVVELKF